MKRRLAIPMMMIVVGAVVIVSSAGCGQQDARPTATSTTTSSAAAKPATSPSVTTSLPARPIQAHGIIVIETKDNPTSYLVQSIDPNSGVVSPVSELTVVGANGGIANGPVAFSSNFDRVAVKKDGLPGWIDTSGTFTPAGQRPSQPEFGDQTEVSVVGFDRLDNFYTQSTTGKNPPVLFRTAKGSTGPGDPVEDTGGVLGRLPGGLLGFGAERGYSEGCGLGEAEDGDFDPDRSSIFYENDGRIYRGEKYCNNDGKPFTERANFTIGSIASSPDQSQIAFMPIGGQRLFLVDANVGGTPKEVPLSGSTEYSSIRAWLP